MALTSKYYIKELESYFKKTNFLDKNNDTCIVILNYNNKRFISKLAEHLKNVNSDILIVDNDSGDGSYEYLLENYKNTFNLIQTTKNLGGAGGFGVGIQWVIERGYDFCFVSEEDALPMKGSEDIFEEMLKYKEKNSIVKARFFELDTDSFTLHYTIYPSWILQSVGTLNIDLFFRADDQEWGMRIRKFLEKENIKIKNIVVDRYYSHPLIKKGFGLFSNYFSIRNAFLVYLKYPNRNFMVDYFTNFTKYLSYGFYSLMNDKNIAPLRQFAFAFYDFLRDDLTKNFIRIDMFKNDKLEPKKYQMLDLNFEDFHKRYSKYCIITSSFNNKHLSGFNFSRNCSKGAIASKYNGVARIKSFFYSKIIFVEEINFIDRKISCFEYNNRFVWFKRGEIIFSIILSFFLATIFFPFVTLKRLKDIR